MASSKTVHQLANQKQKQSLAKACKNMQKPVSSWLQPLQKDQSALLRWLAGRGTVESARFVLHDLDGRLMTEDYLKRQNLLKSLGLRVELNSRA